MLKKCFSICGPFLFLLCSLSLSNGSEFDAITRIYRAISETDCQIPKIQNGSFIVIGSESSKTKPIKCGASVVFKCDLQHELNTEYSNITCEKGKWNRTVPKCIRTCPGFSSEFIELSCELNDKVQNCSKPALEGTIMTMACISHYVDVSNSTEMKTVCQNGTWNRPFLICIPDCGKRIAKGETYIFDGINAPEGEFPWHVGIYKEEVVNTTPKLICGGSIVTTKSIISAAHCFTFAGDGKYRESNYFIGAGKLNSTFSSDEEGNQIRKVQKVEIPNSYSGLKTTYIRDIAILILETELIITQKIQPICIDWDSKYEAETLVDNNYGEVVGWGVTKRGGVASIPLKLLKVPFINEKQCINDVPEEFQKYVSSDKICAGFTNIGRSACTGDSGGGLIFPVLIGKIKTYYIRGLVSNGPRLQDGCDSDHYTVYTKISEYLKFIKEVHKAHNISTSVNTTSVLVGGCVAPEVINGRLILSEFLYLPRLIVPNQSIVTVKCDEGFSLFPPNSLYLTCSFGKWDRPTPHCYVCGQRYNQTSQFEDSITEAPELPWHVSVYRIYNNTRYFFGCGGSIISPSLVITDEKCFPIKQPNNGISDEFQVIAGKYHSEDIIDEYVKEKFEQVRIVRASDVRYSSDIAVVIVKEPFAFSKVIQPVCIDWDSLFELDQLDPRRNGTIASWSPVKYGHEKDQTIVDYQYEQIESCLQEASSVQVRELIKAKFCTSHINGTVVLCQANQGSGLSFINEETQRYYLRGVAVNVFGSRIYCSGKEFNVFAKLSTHFQFILKVIDDTSAIK